MRNHTVWAIAAWLFAASVAFGQNDPSYYHIYGTDSYVNPNPSGYGGFGGGYGYNSGYGYGTSSKAQNILAVGSVLYGLFKKSPAESQAHAQVRQAELEHNGPVAQALAEKIRYEARSKEVLTRAEAARMYSGSDVTDDDNVTADGGTHRSMHVTGGQAVHTSLSPDYDALGSSESSGRHTVSMAHRGRRRRESSYEDRIARLRERRNSEDSETTEVSGSTSDEEPEAPKPPKKRHHRAKKAVETPDSGPPEKEAPSFGGRERPPWDE